MKPALGILLVVGVGAIALSASGKGGGQGYSEEKKNCIDTVARALQNILQDNRTNPALLEVAAVQLTNLGFPDSAQCVRDYIRGAETECIDRFADSITKALANGMTPALKANQKFFYDWLNMTGHKVAADCFAMLTGMQA